MLLSKLVFLAVKNVVYLDDNSFNYEDFIKGNFDNDIDYAANINNVFSPLNEAISRLSDLERIPYIVTEATVNSDLTINLTSFGNQVKEVKNVAVIGTDGSYRKLAHRMFGKDKVRIVSPFTTFNNKVYIEYKENIPSFSIIDIEPLQIVDGVVNDNNIDLYLAYGITNSMCDFIMEYVQGKLLEPIAPELANAHITRAEAYFSNINPTQSSFPQQVVEKKYEIGDGYVD